MADAGSRAAWQVPSTGFSTPACGAETGTQDVFAVSCVVSQSNTGSSRADVAVLVLRPRRRPAETQPHAWAGRSPAAASHRLRAPAPLTGTSGTGDRPPQSHLPYCPKRARRSRLP